MNIIFKKIKEINPYIKNPRINKDAVPYVANSIEEFGFKNPIIIDKNNIIICGHTRFLAAKRLKLKEVPCIIADDLTDEQINAYRLADNKVAEKSEWDFDLLKGELESILDIDMEKFDFDLNFGEEEEDIEIIEDEIPDVKEDPKSKLGQIYKLGRHRLMCGSSTETQDVLKLSNGNNLDLTITSPPYGCSSACLRENQKDAEKKIKSFYITHEDKPEEWLDLMINFFENSQKITKSQFINVQMLADNKMNLISFWEKYKNNFVDLIVWNKHTAPPQIDKNVLTNAFEFVFIFDNKNNSRSIRYGDFRGNKTNYLETKREQNQYADIHKAVYSIEFVEKILDINKNAKTIYDPFGGTGTTLIACEQLNKICYIMELDPLYVDVIIQRWENLTGEKAELINE